MSLLWRHCQLLLQITLLISLPVLTYAHQNSESYLDLKLTKQQIQGQWSINLLDLELAFGLDRNTDGEIRWEEVLLVEANLREFAFDHLQISQQMSLQQDFRSCQLATDDVLVDNRTTGTYLVFPFTATCPDSVQLLKNPLRLNYSLLFDQDRQHQAVVTYQWQDQGELSASGVDIIRFAERQLLIAPSQSILSGTVEVFLNYFLEGIWHIWIGLDHILFLVALIVPSVRQAKSNKFIGMLYDVTTIVTCFTIAHSVTLIAASMHWVILPARLVETAIALSVVLAGLNMLYPVFDQRRWLVALVFGLIHGLGFASVLSELTLSSTHFLSGLLGFNLGVEFGQLVIVAVLLPGLYIVRHFNYYQRLLIPGAGASITAVGCIWAIGRGFLA